MLANKKTVTKNFLNVFQKTLLMVYCFQLIITCITDNTSTRVQKRPLKTTYCEFSHSTLFCNLN